jgi:hypothetical protein
MLASILLLPKLKYFEKKKNSVLDEKQTPATKISGFICEYYASSSISIYFKIKILHTTEYQARF